MERIAHRAFCLCKYKPVQSHFMQHLLPVLQFLCTGYCQQWQVIFNKEETGTYSTRTQRAWYQLKTQNYSPCYKRASFSAQQTSDALAKCVITVTHMIICRAKYFRFKRCSTKNISKSWLLALWRNKHYDSFVLKTAVTESIHNFVGVFLNGKFKLYDHNKDDKEINKSLKKIINKIQLKSNCSIIHFIQHVVP